ncbi:MAG: hypothetical protein PUF12_02085 [Thermoflexaceae bacterium]|nr:hypothetical protein [Thermoflexaceae bacterium]
MLKKVILLLLISMFLTACQKNAGNGNGETSAAITENVTETTDEVVIETTTKKDINEYKDCTTVIGNSFKELAENPNLIPVRMTGDFGKSYDTVEDLCSDSICVVRGKIIDLTYSDTGSSGKTFYSFAVEEVLWGGEIKEETIVTMYDCQGYVRLKTYREVYGNSYAEYEDEAEKTYMIYSFGEPLVQIGEEYVLFVQSKDASWEYAEVEGEFYRILAPYVGKFRLNEEGLYERYLPENDKQFYELIKPLSLEEIKEQLAGE